MGPPLVGIPPCLDARGRWKPRRLTQYIDAAYSRAVAAAGGLPVYLALDGEPEALVARLDGLLLPGGDDLPPDRPYPETARFDLAPERQVARDRALLAAALERDLPVLAICYGMQLMALELGGRLHYHLPSDLPGAGPHQLPDPEARHGLRVAPGSLLARVLADAEPAVNSRHHQGVAEPGPRLRACAHADDGVIEAVEAPELRFCLGVQWHPEGLDGPHGERLFAAFVRASQDASDTG